MNKSNNILVKRIGLKFFFEYTLGNHMLQIEHGKTEVRCVFRAKFEPLKKKVGLNPEW